MIYEKLKKLTLSLRKERSPLAPTMAFHASEITNIGKNRGNRETTEDEAIQYVKRAVAGLKANHHSDATEIALLEELLPRLASVEEIEAFLNTIDTSNRGATMKAAKEHFGALIDMKLVASMVK